jgi:uncharacterized phage protein (TIGR01671 family)
MLLKPALTMKEIFKMNQPLIAKASRPVEYRSFNKATGEMTYDVILMGDSQTEIEDEILMIYTGRTDDAGTKIYEGDIVAVDSTADYDDERNIVSDVIWNDKDLQIQVRSREGDDVYEHGLALTWGGWATIKVIGNIYQNAELLEGKVAA